MINCRVFFLIDATINKNKVLTKIIHMHIAYLVFTKRERERERDN